MGNRLIIALLRSPLHRIFSRVLMILEVQGSKTGRWYRFPVQYLQDEERLLVWVGKPASKRWWRNLETRPHVRMVLRGRRLTGSAGTIRGDSTSEAALYASRFPRLVRRVGGISPDDVFVEITPDP